MSPFQIIEIQSKSNLAILENMTKITWHNKANELDKWACENCTAELAKKNILNSYLTTRQIAWLLRDLINKPEVLSGTRVFCSLDPVSHAVEGILVARKKETTCEIMFALTNPDNLELPGHQKKAKSGAVLTLMLQILRIGEECTDFMVEAKDPVYFDLKKLGFEETGEKAQASYLKVMRLSQNKAQELIAKVPFNGEVVPEISLND